MYFTIFSTKNGSNPWLIAHGRLPPRSAASFRCSEGWSGRWDSPGPVEIAISKNGSTGKIGFLEWFQISQLFQIHLVIDDHWGSPGSPSQVSLGLSHLSFELQQCTASVLRVAKSQRCRPWMDRNPDYSIGGPFLEWINSVLFSVYSYLLSRSMENLMKKTSINVNNHKSTPINISKHQYTSIHINTVINTVVNSKHQNTSTIINKHQ